MLSPVPTETGKIHAMEHPSQDPFDAPVDDGTANRQEPRDSLFLMADFRVAGSDRVCQVRVRNLSSGGLMAEFPNGLAPGVCVEVGVRGIGWVPGCVAWYAAGRIGVAFDQTIDPLLARKPVGRGGHTPGFAKPISRGNRR